MPSDCILSPIRSIRETIIRKKKKRRFISIIPTSPPPIYYFLQLTALFSFAPHASFSINLRHRSTALLVRIRQQRALVELLRAGRHVDGRVAREEVDGLEADFEDLAGHHGEVFDARDLVKGGFCQWVGVGI